MARPKKHIVKLTDDEVKKLKSVIRKKKTSRTIRSRCQIILDLDEAHGKVLTHEQSAKSNGVCQLLPIRFQNIHAAISRRLLNSKETLVQITQGARLTDVQRHG